MKPGGIVSCLYTGVLLLGLFATVAAAGDEHFVVRKGDARAEIVLPEKPPRSTRLAAAELRTYVEKISGATLPLVFDPSADVPVQLYVGRSEHTEKRGVTGAGLKHGAYRLVSGDGWMVFIGDDTPFEPIEPWAKNNGDRVSGWLQEQWEKITGEQWGVPNGGMYKNRKRFPGDVGLPEAAGTERREDLTIWTYDARGSFNAVCGFLRNLGVRWYMPGPLGEVVPRKRSIPLPDVDRIVKPDVPIRRFPILRFGTADHEVVKWAMRLGIRNPYGFQVAHGMHTMTEPAAIRKKHPEWFALYGGERDTDPDERTNQLCYSNEQLLDHAVRWARAQFDVYDVPAVSIMPPDGYVSICECELCEGKADPGRGSRGRLSNYVWTFVNRVARKVRKTHPEKKIVCCAYGPYTKPPTNIEKLADNVQVVIVGGRRPRRSRPEQREPIRRLRERWLAKTDNKIMIFENYPFTSRGFYLPAFVARTIGESINATKGISRGEDVWLSLVRDHEDEDIGFDHFQIYFTARMYWGGKDRDVGAMLDEYCRLFYGPAGEEMNAFFDYCEAHWQAMEEDAGKANRALEMFAAAQEQVSSGSVHAKRLAKIDDFLEELRSRAEQLAQKRGPVPKIRTVWEPKEPIDVDGRFDDAFWARHRDWTVHHLRELRTGRQPVFGTSVMAGWGRRGENLYFAIRCEERPGDGVNVTTRTDDDPSIWNGDVVEILLDTDAHSYYQIAVNPAGAVADLDRGAEKQHRFRWDSQAEVATHVAEDHWNVEIRIPVTGDANDPLHRVVGRTPSKSLPWHVNVCRKRVRDSGTELSAFAPTAAGTFHKPIKFAHFYHGRSHNFEADPEVTDYVIERKTARTLRREGKYEEALDAYVALAGSETVSEFQKADALERAAACARHLDDVRRAENLADRIPIEAVSKTVHMENLLAQRRWSALIERYGEEDLSAWPFWQRGDGAFARGQAHSRNGAGEKAEADLKRALPFTPDTRTRQKVLLQLARNYERNLNDEKRALRTYKRIVGSGEHTGSAAYYRAVISAARIRREQGKLRRAGRILENVQIETLHGFWLGRMLLARGRLHAAAGRNEKARKVYRRILDGESTRTSHRRAARQALERAGDPERRP